MSAPPAPTVARRRAWLGPMVILVIALALGAGAMLGGGGKDERAAAPDRPTPPTGSTEEQAAEEVLAGLARRQEGDPLALGAVDAPVVMIEWADFQCPFCGRFARETKPELVQQYVDAGVLRIEWRDFPYLGEQSDDAALAGRAAAQQGQFWEFHDALYALELPPNSGQLTRERLVEIAGQISLDTAAFTAALDDPALAEAVQADFTEGQMLGVTGTPTFLVGDQPVVGAQPLEVFQQAIDSAAAGE